MVDNKYIFANIYTTNYIVMIDKATGNILKKWDLSDLSSIQNQSGRNWSYYDKLNNVFNGIAYLKGSNTFLVTGKMWDYIFEIQLY